MITRRLAVALLATGLLVSCGLSEVGDNGGSGSDAGLDQSQDVELPDTGEEDSASDATGDDGDAFYDVEVDQEAGDATEDAEADALDASDAPSCGGMTLGGYCWYASAPAQSCDQACAGHGGCDLTGTRDYAGSGGSDANCVAILGALGFGSYPHQNWSNNDLGCQFDFGSWTYWSAAKPTTCGASAGGAAAAVRACACNQ